MAEEYIDTTYLEAYALERGRDISAETGLDGLIVQGCDYVDMQSPFKGGRVTVDQLRQFPRAGLVVDGFSYSTDVIPEQVKAAAAEAALLALDGEDLTEAQTVGVTREKVDVIETEYSENQRKAGQTVFPRIHALLLPFKRSGLRLAR